MRKLIVLVLITALFIAIYLYFKKRKPLKDPLYQEIQGVELNGINWREDIDKRYQASSGKASGEVEKLVDEFFENKLAHTEIMGTGKTLHNSDNLAYLIVVNAFGIALESNLIQLR